MAIKERRKAHGKVFMVEGGGWMQVRLLNLKTSQPHNFPASQPSSLQGFHPEPQNRRQ